MGIKPSWGSGSGPPQAHRDRSMPEHIVAVAVIVNGGQVLLVHRHSRRDWYPDCWDLVGGHLESGESAFQALRRECREEVGIDVRAAWPLVVPSSDSDVDVHAFAVTAWVGTQANLALDEHDDLGWFHVGELAALRLADPACLPVIIDVLEAGRGG